MYVQRYDGLEEGEYGVHLRLPGRPSAQAQGSFSCAEFSLSPLIAILETHRIDGAQLHLQIKLTQLTAPYSGPVEIKLLSGERVLHRREHQAQEGRLSVELSLDERWWGGHQAMRVELVTPEGNTATIALPGVTSEEREHIQLCPLDRTECDASTHRGLSLLNGRRS